MELCLKSVQAAITTMDAEIIVVDNASADDSCEMVRMLFPDVVFIANKENVGFSTANNQGVAIAQGEYICILNPDTCVTEETFTKLFDFAAKTPKMGAVGTRLIDGTGRFLPESKRNLPTPKVAFQKIFGSGTSYYVEDLKEKDVGPVTVLVGAFMFLKRTVYQKVGGFDEQYFMYGEDIDLSYTIAKAGYQNYYFGETTVLHYKGESTAKDATYRKRFYGAMRIFYQKHFKSNPLESFGVKIGLWLATLSRKRITEDQTIPPTGYAIITENDQLGQQVSDALQVDVEKVKNIESLKEGTEVFLDVTYLSYIGCIQLISEYTDKEFTYKIIPKNTTFAIGSNSKEGRGEVLHF